jgi:hypothetical protein
MASATLHRAPPLPTRVQVGLVALPWKTPAVRAVAVALAVIGIAVAFAPEKVPGLTIPGSPAAMPAMEMEAASPALR